MHPIEPFLRESYTRADVHALVEHLEAAGTFQFPALSTGLFSAALAGSSDFESTGYAYVWVRDNVHIAHMYHVLGRQAIAAKTVRALTQFLHTQRPRLDAIICGNADARQAMNRPHVRFDGTKLAEVPQTWAHAQNDALGYWMWLFCRTHEGALAAADVELLAAFVKYFAAIQFWHDEDSGHWEEAPKIEASSIGVATAGLRALRDFLQERAEGTRLCYGGTVLTPLLDQLIKLGQDALAEILPAECVQDDPAKKRACDAALLFLIYPIGLASGQLAEHIVSNVVDNLLGPYGIRRYRGDSYWCQDYKQTLPADQRTSDFSADMSMRDRLLQPGLEAQWCIFDPILSIIHGQHYQAARDAERLRLQTHHLNRSLRQLTADNTPFGPLRCPESYYCEAGRYVPNDITPLLWTQANLRLALHMMERSVS